MGTSQTNDTANLTAQFTSPHSLLTATPQSRLFVPSTRARLQIGVGAASGAPKGP
jgi:hypothetical protein